MTAVSILSSAGESARSVFSGADVCGEAGLTLPDAVRRPVFDDDFWDLAQVAGLPVQLALRHRRFDFTQITDPRWRLVAKELIIPLLAPCHPAVASLPRAYRAPHHVSRPPRRADPLHQLAHHPRCRLPGGPGRRRLRRLPGAPALPA